MNPWVERCAKEIAHRAERHLEALVAVSSPSGDIRGAEECASVCAALVPDAAEVERMPCSSPGHAPDLLVRLAGEGTRRVLLLGHLDTVVSHAEHRPLARVEDRLVGSGAVDMKGGVVLALGALRALAQRTQDFAEVALLVVCDEEWRSAPFLHGERFAGWDACLCFEAGELTPEGAEGVIVRRKAAGTIRVHARGRAAHSGSAPDRGLNALLALATAAQSIAGRHAPQGPDRLTAVPTVMRAGEAFNVVPDRGELICDLRADEARAIIGVMEALPRDVDGVELDPELIRLWPSMHSEAATAPLLASATEALGRSVEGVRRGGASDASHFADAIAVTVDGLGPRGGRAHNPEEYVLAPSLQPRAEVALAVIEAALTL